VAEGPLAGTRVVVTRPRGTGARLRPELEELGAEVAEVPLVEIEPAEPGALATALSEDADWIVVTSANAVRAAGTRLQSLSRGRFAAVGPATADALRELGIEPAFVPDRFAAGAVAEGLGSVEGLRVLLPQADIASPELADELRRRGASVDVVVAYRTVELEPDEDGVAAIRSADAVLLASGSAARSLAALGFPLEGAAIVCIGPSTALEAEAAGLNVRCTADEATGAGMIRALVSIFGGSE
jgi:uroporphyrinogen-III synthase